MTDKPLDGFGVPYRDGIQQLGKHDFRNASTFIGPAGPTLPAPADFETVHGDDLVMLRWMRENREAVKALLAGKAAVVPVELTEPMWVRGVEVNVTTLENDGRGGGTRACWEAMLGAGRLDRPEARS